MTVGLGVVSYALCTTTLPRACDNRQMLPLPLQYLVLQVEPFVKFKGSHHALNVVVLHAHASGPYFSAGVSPCVATEVAMPAAADTMALTPA